MTDREPPIDAAPSKIERVKALLTRSQEAQVRAEALLRRTPKLTIPDSAVPADHPLAGLFGGERGQHLVNILNGKPYAQRDAATWRRELVARMTAEGKSRREIADAAGCSEGWIAELQSRL